MLAAESTQQLAAAAAAAPAAAPAAAMTHATCTCAAHCAGSREAGGGQVLGGAPTQQPRDAPQVAGRERDLEFRSLLLANLLVVLPALDSELLAAGLLSESAMGRVVAKAKRGYGFASSEDLLCTNQVGACCGLRGWWCSSSCSCSSSSSSWSWNYSGGAVQPGVPWVWPTGQCPCPSSPAPARAGSAPWQPAAPWQPLCA